VSVIAEYLKLTLPLCSQYEALTQNTALVANNILRDKFVPRDESCNLNLPKSFRAASNFYVPSVKQERFSRTPERAPNKISDDNKHVDHSEHIKVIAADGRPGGV
jgi:hypothetical protein